MPRIEDIERFAQFLQSLGNEPAIRAARSETVEEMPAPGEPSAEEATDQGEEDSGFGGRETSPEEAGTTEAEGLQDIFQSLSELPDEGGGEEAAGQPEEFPGGEPASPPSDQSEGLDFASLFGEETTPQGIEDLEEPGARPAPSRPAASPRARTEAPAEDAFSLPEGELDSLGADLSALETLPDELAGGQAAEEPGPELTAGPDAAEGDPSGDLGSFSLPGELEASEPAEPAAGVESGGAESFDLPNLDDIAFSEPSAGAQMEPPAEPAEPSLEQPGEFGGEEFQSGPSAEPTEETVGGSGAEAGGGEPMPTFDLDAGAFGDLGAGTEGTAFEASVDELPPETSESDLGAAGTGAEEPSADSGEGLQGLGDEGLGDLDLDEFSLPESAGQFGVEGLPAAEPAAPAPPPRPQPAPRQRAERRARPVPPPPVEETESGEIAEGPVELTPEQFARLKSSLASLPRNLKIVVQDLIAQGTVSGPDLSALLGLLLRGASAQEIAALAGKVSGKRIRVPAGYEKKSGMAFEAEQRTFGYAFRENFLPLARVVALTVLAGALFGFLGYNYFYRPVLAWINYRSGYAQIANDRFTLANERFDRGTALWALKPWYYRYAEAFADKRNYRLAEEKYDQLLKSWPLDKKGILDYARMESTALADYPKADTLLAQYLDAHPRDYQVLLAAGDNDLAWADKVKAKYEAARVAYATLLEDYGVRDEVLFRMLRYFIRTDNADEVERLRLYYAARPEVKIDAPAYAELGGYLVDHRRLDYAQQVLFRADKDQPGLPEVHYNLARYYRIVSDPSDEKKALDATRALLDRTKDTAPLTTRRLNMEIDTRTRLGEYEYRTKQYIPAERDLQDAIRMVEAYQQQKIIGQDPLYGRPYAVLGDLSYYIEDNLAVAAQQYQKASDNLFTSPLLAYKIGYVRYFQKDFKGALDSLAQAEDASVYPSVAQELEPVSVTATTAAVPPPPAGQPLPSADAPPSAPVTPPGDVPQNLLYALGDTFYQRGDFFAAQASFLRLRDRLESRRASLGILHPEDRPDDRALMETIVKVNNNLGVTLARLAERTGDRRKRSEALVYLSAANEIAASLARSPETVKRSEDRALPSLNMRAILFPARGDELNIYADLPKDFQAAAW